MNMSKSTLFVLAGFLFVSVAFGGDATGNGRAPLHGKAPRRSFTAVQDCVSRGHRSACNEVSRRICSNLKCQGVRGNVVYIGQAPDDMWCAPFQLCRNGQCRVDESIPEPSDYPTYANC